MTLRPSGWLLLLLWTAGCGGSSGGQAPDEPAIDFSIVALPDTQRYSHYHPEIFQAQTGWIVENAERYRIVFVTHLGDIVDAGDQPAQWEAADIAMALLDQAGIPYGTCLGNHDLTTRLWQLPDGAKLTSAGCTPEAPQDGCAGRMYLERFGPARFQGKTWYGGTSPTGLSNFQRVETEGLTLLFLHLAIDPEAGELAWAQQVIDDHPAAAVHISTHRYLIDFRITETMPDPLPLVVAGRAGDLVSLVDPLHFPTSISGQKLFEQFIATNPGIYMVQCGHVDAEFFQSSQNQAGSPVHEILTDFQELAPDGGRGWLKILHFNLKDRKVRVRTYSPTLNRYRENGEGFDHAVEMVQHFLTDFHDTLALLTDIEAVDEMAEYLTNTTEGRKEYYDALYGDGQRDSDFTLDLDLAQYGALR